MPRLRHYDHTGAARFVTFTCYRRHQYLASSHSCHAVLEQMVWVRSELAVPIMGYVIMPDHVHLVLLPPDGLRLGLAIGQMKARSARVILSSIRDDSEKPTTNGGPPLRSVVLARADGSAAIWERRCYDHNCRTPEVVAEKIRYCHENPVKRGLATRPEEWAWSSSRWYLGQRDGVFEIDGYEM